MTKLNALLGEKSLSVVETEPQLARSHGAVKRNRRSEPGRHDICEEKE
jgi:hypothetical protein